MLNLLKFKEVTNLNQRFRKSYYKFIIQVLRSPRTETNVKIEGK